MRLPFHQIDAFATRAFEGNQACVMPLESWLPDATLQAIADENNVAETAFYIPATDPSAADFDLRWFTPTVEVALCGHATLASGHLVLSVDPARAVARFATRRAGVLEVRRADSGYALELPAWPATALTRPPAALAAALGAPPTTVLARGADYLVAVFDTAAQVRALAPDFRALRAMAGGDVLIIATASGAGDPSGRDVVSRVFAPGAGIDEDPATGSAHAILAPYWAERLGRRAFTAWQASARGAAIGCELDGDRVRLWGGCVTTIEGVFHL